MRLAMIENLGQAEPYSHQKGIFPAREAVVMQQQDRGITDITAEEVFIGNDDQVRRNVALDHVVSDLGRMTPSELRGNSVLLLYRHDVIDFDERHFKTAVS